MEDGDGKAVPADGGEGESESPFFDDEDDGGGFVRFHDAREKSRAAKQQAAAVKKLTASAEGLEGGLKTTYQPSRHEATWLLQSLGDFFERTLIDDILYAVKGGKEASVYCCRPHPDAREAVGADFLAAKVYRPRMLRNLRNDKLYREGRPILTEDGRAIKKTDHRILRALGKKTEFGAAVQHTSWLMYEFTTLQRLYDLGCAVPRPIAASENALLMGFAGDGTRGAPTLIEVALTPAEARSAFQQVRASVAILLAEGLVHGDLSAYNILWWDAHITLIDFPQVVFLGENPHAEEILARDLTRLCEYFTRQGIACAPEDFLPAGGLPALGRE